MTRHISRRTIIALAMAAVSAVASVAQVSTVRHAYGKPGAFSDIALVYAGNSNRNVWTTDQLAPYVTHVYSDGSEDWFFDAFLFLEFVRTVHCPDGSVETHGFGNGMGGDRPATQADWLWILDEYFAGTRNGEAVKLAALDSLVGEKVLELGAPPSRRKVVVVCPAPKKDGNVWSSQPWGTIDGMTVTFESEADRVTAVKWYIDQLLSRWEDAGFRNIDLDGIYWIEEGMISNAGIIADVNDYARSRGLHSYWIPYYRSGNEPYCRRWESDFKFDMCFFQPNYAFYQADGSLMPESQLVNTCRAAHEYGAGVEVEFETSGRSNALHSANPECHSRINDYLDVYTDEGVFDAAGVAYYVGSRGLNDMHASTDSIDHATIDRMARIVSRRQRERMLPQGVVSGTPDSLTFTSLTPDGIFEVNFCKCMANDIFTFCNVWLDGTPVNSAEHSDNIGPFLICGHGWTGGNHLSDTGSKTARTTSVEVRADGVPFSGGIIPCHSMDVTVTNDLLLPDGSLFAVEKVRYLVARNSIEVWVDHEYKIASEMTVDRYYGMQSMFVGEDSILVPGAGEYGGWTAIIPGGAENSLRIKHRDAPQISVFVEKSADAYQASWMLPDGLGCRSRLDSDDVAFVGNSYGKCYHKLMGMSAVTPGCTTRWHGLYSWFGHPVADTFATGSDAPRFVYRACMGGCNGTVTIDEQGCARFSELCMIR